MYKHKVIVKYYICLLISIIFCKYIIYIKMYNHKVIVKNYIYLLISIIFTKYNTYQ